MNGRYNIDDSLWRCSSLPLRETFVLRIDKKSESRKSKRCTYLSEEYDHHLTWIFFFSADNDDDDGGGIEMPRLIDLFSSLAKELTEHGDGVIVVIREKTELDLFFAR